MAKKAGGKRAGDDGVDKYIAKAPEEVRGRLKAIRAAVRAAAPGATERTDYFRLPGYSLDDRGYDYDGMFVWFSYKGREARLHVRPPVIQNHMKELAGCATTKAIVAFPADKALSAALVKKLVKASVKVMKDRAK